MGNKLPQKCASFIYYLYVKLDLKRFGTGSGVPTLNRNDVHVQSVALPKDSKEQASIGNYFRKLDALINQHQQKHNKLSNIKKSMLEKMFPKEGKTIPEIRLKGFSEEWVERSWSETVDISTNMVDPRNCQYGELFHVGPGNIESFTGNFYNNVLKVKDSNLISGKFHFNKGDIIYGKINPQLAKYVIAPFEGLASADTYVLNTKNGVVQNFLFAVLHTEDFYKYTVSVSSRTGMPKINRDELNVYSYMAPSESEQAQIGNYFQKLNALLNLHQQQITSSTTSSRPA
ncbi:restriction endonuclease subunit S [Enterobacter hormaechei]